MLVREEFNSVVPKLQIQRMVTHCMFLTGTQKSTGFFLKSASLLIIGHLSLQRISLGSTVLYFLMLVLKTLFVVIAVALPKKPTISMHLPSLLTAKQTAYCCEPQQNQDTFTSEAHHHFLIRTESTSSFPLPRSQMQQCSQTPDSSIMVHQTEMQEHRLIA